MAFWLIFGKNSPICTYRILSSGKKPICTFPSLCVRVNSTNTDLVENRICRTCFYDEIPVSTGIRRIPVSTRLGKLFYKVVLNITRCSLHCVTRLPLKPNSDLDVVIINAVQYHLARTRFDYMVIRRILYLMNRQKRLNRQLEDFITI